jgi:raffinose/stachyose/melibiose transport system permease protein
MNTSTGLGNLLHMRWSRNNTVNLLIYVALALVLVFYLYPFWWIIGGSLKTNREFFSTPLNLIPAQAQWQNYITAWNKAHFGNYFLNTVIVTSGVVLGTVIFASMAGYALGRANFPGRGLLQAMIVITMFLPAGYTIIPTFEIMLKLGLTNTLWALIILGVAGPMGFYTFLYWGFFSTLPKEMEEAAVVDGANGWQVYFYIMLPLAAPMTGTVALLSFLASWNDFFTPLIFTLGKPELRTMAVGMFAFIGENSTDWTPMLAATIITLLPVIIVFLFLQRYIIEAVAGAIK